MDAKNAPVEMFFFPFVGGGHQIPMIDTARVFAAHGAKSTIITTLSNALQFQKSITRDQQCGLAITIHSLTLPENADITDIDMSAGPFTDTSILREPFRHLLTQHRPDCIVIDMFHRWATEVIDELQIKRVVFNGNGCFPYCVNDNLRRYTPHDKVGSNSEAFIIPGLPDRIQMTRSQLPNFLRRPSAFPDRLKSADEKSFGTVINSFYELEPSYANYLRNEMGKKVWIIGPVSLCNRNAADKTERGKLSTIDEQSCLNWLNSKQPNSVVYISFGSLARLPPEQLMEIAYALEASDQSFIWVVGKIFNASEEEETWLPSGFEERIRESNKGLIVRGWAPQLLILEHGAVGGFMTHCGWNSTLEGFSAGKPMITWPLSAEQFSNEKLVTDVLRVGVKVGNQEWASWDEKRRTVVGREKVEVALKKLMGNGEDAEDMRRRVKDIAEKARRAVQHGETSYADADALIQELKAQKQC
ncbi:hypothetical protein L6164_035692 [Bauhinia variegata]|uniref:Uncharacterized protein n=1 Tax=Bauhinia variegata TaxID=167791 RepID=A0ACB9KER2_BAUVA|nr:hypothetical protein L6164_035692 [Bauhinia variegata]